MARKYHMIGNWKMNQNLEEIKSFFVEFGKLKQELNCEAWIAPQAVHIPIVKELAFTTGNILVGAQNSCDQVSGAFTGETSSAALKDLGAHFVLVGHSERRAIYKEDHQLLLAKTKTALAQGLKVVFCVGESLEQREANQTQSVVKEQLDEGLKGLSSSELENVIIAYEPVWAIGTGKTASPEQAGDVHKFIRGHISSLGFNSEETIILYGGSVKPENVDGLLAQPDVDGGLVGGASLKGSSFSELCLGATRASN